LAISDLVAVVIVVVMFQGMKGTAILTMIEQGERLLKPDMCPNNVYDVMRKCWTYKYVALKVTSDT
jgi:hypothetical protein